MRPGKKELILRDAIYREKISDERYGADSYLSFVLSQVQRAASAFQKYDTLRAGVISFADFDRAINAHAIKLGWQEPPLPRVRAMFTIADMTSSGSIDLNEFVYMQRQRKERSDQRKRAKEQRDGPASASASASASTSAFTTPAASPAPKSSRSPMRNFFGSFSLRGGKQSPEAGSPRSYDAGVGSYDNGSLREWPSGSASNSAANGLPLAVKPAEPETDFGAMVQWLKKWRAVASADR
ncbi:hypothetical protein T492DRAFT_880707 [Pavlovales sp. CCMP2436]|nr:hypothetical protein T492DRAFT_880707 [Pavlovales sp. CCMP2436]